MTDRANVRSEHHGTGLKLDLRRVLAAYSSLKSLILLALPTGIEPVFSP
jgi:hypothetical protein